MAFNNTSFAANTMFSGALPGAVPFRVTAGFDTVVADISVGANLPSNGGWALKLSYDGHYGDRVRDSGFQLKASLMF